MNHWHFIIYEYAGSIVIFRDEAKKYGRTFNATYDHARDLVERSDWRLIIEQTLIRAKAKDNMRSLMLLADEYAQKKRLGYFT